MRKPPQLSNSRRVWYHSRRDVGASDLIETKGQNKMAFIKVKTSRNPNQINFKKTDQRVANLGCYKYGNKGTCINIRLSKKILDDMKWILGDRVNVFFDDENETRVMIERSNDGQLRLSKSGGDGKSNLKFPCSIKFKTPENLPFILSDVFYAEDFTFENNSIFMEFTK